MATTRTVRQLLERALKRIEVYEVGQTTDSSDIQNALEVFQDLIAEHAGSLFIPYYVQESLSMVASQASYTIGENGTPDLDTQRPEQIIGAFVREGTYDYPLRIIQEQGYRLILSKDTESSRPEYLYYNPTAPNGTIYLYSTPTTTDSLYIVSLKTLTEPTTLTQNVLDDLSIPRNYHNHLSYMLAVELAPEYGLTPNPIIIAKADMALSDIKAINLARTIQPAGIDLANQNTGRPNILTLGA